MLDQEPQGPKLGQLGYGNVRFIIPQRSDGQIEVLKLVLSESRSIYSGAKKLRQQTASRMEFLDPYPESSEQDGGICKMQVYANLCKSMQICICKSNAEGEPTSMAPIRPSRLEFCPLDCPISHGD